MKDRLLYKLLDEYQKSDALKRKRIVDIIRKDMHSKSSVYWKNRLSENVQELFKFAKKNIPAYKKFLQREKVIMKKGKAVIPISTKPSYLRQFPILELCDPASLRDDRLIMTATSGSTGQPFYFPRNHVIDIQSSIYHEVFLRNAGINPKDPILVIVGFGMGVWIGGLITYEAFKAIGERGFAISLITPGVNKIEIYDALKNIGPLYRNIILCGYPPFIKDILDGSKEAGVRWDILPPLKIIFAAEMFSEKFRDHIIRKARLGNPYRDTMNIYGTADIGTMAIETPVSILIRRLIVKKKNLFRKLFPDVNRLPTLAQFNPDFISFEEIDGQLYLSGYNALPLIRYAIGDNGGVRQFIQVREMLREEGIDLDKEIRDAKIEDTIEELPFVYVYERTDLSTKLYGAIIYPEHIRNVIQDDSFSEHLTGRFAMITKHDRQHDEYLEVNIELTKGKSQASEELHSSVVKAIVAGLIEHNSEYKNNYLAMKERVIPRLTFWPYEYPEYFKRNAKQKWVLKEKH